MSLKPSDAPMPAAPMLADMARQPAVLAALAERADAFRALGRDVLTPGPGGRIHVTGCGDGLFAGEAASGLARALGLDWRAVGALDIALAPADLRPSDRVIAISMSGNVDRTVEAARAVAERGVPLLALVNGDGGRLGQIATRKISLELSDLAPFLCGTASYSATILALMLLASGAAGAPVPAGIEAAQAAQKAALAASEAALAPGVAAPSGVRILSAGAEMGTARYGAAKLVELTRIPAWSGDLEEFAHSQYWAMPLADLVVVIAPHPALAAYAAASCEALSKLGVDTLAIDAEHAPVPTARRRITLPALPSPLAPLATAIPLQRLAYALAKAQGLDPDTRLHLKQDAERFAVSRMLTRRSLLGTGQ
jgi:fructoselysine-6-P-deglycase FrlB-like protein